MQWHKNRDKKSQIATIKSKSNDDETDTVWKFNKTRQVWLLKHMYMLEKVPPKYFKILLKYLATIQGDANRQVSSTSSI